MATIAPDLDLVQEFATQFLTIDRILYRIVVNEIVLNFLHTRELADNPEEDKLKHQRLGDIIEAGKIGKQSLHIFAAGKIARVNAQQNHWLKDVPIKQKAAVEYVCPILEVCASRFLERQPTPWIVADGANGGLILVGHFVIMTLVNIESTRRSLPLNASMDHHQ